MFSPFDLRHSFVIRDSSFGFSVISTRSHPQNMRPPIVVVGSANTDLVIRVPRLPGPGETVTGSRFEIVAGGKGANQAVAAARAGANVTFIGNVGRDPFGDAALQRLR